MNDKISDTKRIVLTTFGSFGDIHPYVAIALELKERGHKPVIVTSEFYREKFETLGIEFHPMRPELPAIEDPKTIELIDKIMDVNKGAEFLFKDLLVPAVRDSYEDLKEAIKGADLFVTHPITLAGHALAQKTGINWVSTVLAPVSLWSDYDPFVPPNAPWLHPFIKFGGTLTTRGFKKLIELVTNFWLKDYYRFRKELGLPKGKNPLFDGQYSPQLNLGLFSKVMAKPQPDWTPNTHITGFPFYDKKDHSNISPDLLKFLDEGEPPIVFTLGSSAVHIAGEFFKESIKAAKQLNRRAVLLVGDDKHKPKDLPDVIAAFDYAPYSELLPRACCIVHQGGVGTTGQGLRSGIPTLIVPFSHDQPDNAARTVRIGVGRTISRKDYKAERVVKELKELLENPSYAERAKAVGEKVRAENGAKTAVDLMLKLLEEKNK